MSRSKSRLRELAAQIPPAEKRFYDKTDDIATRIHQLLERRGMTQQDLAEATGKGKSYISRVLAGSVNLTQKTVAEFEAVLEADILVVPGLPKPKKRRRPTGEVDFVPAPSEKPRPISGVGIDDDGHLRFREEPSVRIDTSREAPAPAQEKDMSGHELADVA